MTRVINQNSIIFSISVALHLAYFVILNSYSQSSHKCNFMMYLDIEQNFATLRNSQIAGAAKIACQQQLLLVEQSTMLRRTEYDIT